MKLFKVGEVAKMLEVSISKITNYMNRGFIGPEGVGKGKARKLSLRDIDALKICLALTKENRVIPKLGREGLYNMVDKEWHVIAIYKVDHRVKAEIFQDQTTARDQLTERNVKTFKLINVDF